MIGTTGGAGGGGGGGWLWWQRRPGGLSGGGGLRVYLHVSAGALIQNSEIVSSDGGSGGRGGSGGLGGEVVLEVPVAEALVPLNVAAWPGQAMAVAVVKAAVEATGDTDMMAMEALIRRRL